MITEAIENHIAAIYRATPGYTPVEVGELARLWAALDALYAEEEA